MLRLARARDLIIWGRLFCIRAPEILDFCLTGRTLQNEFFNQVWPSGTITNRFVSKNCFKTRQSELEKLFWRPISSNFSFFHRFFSRKIDDFSRVQQFHRRFAPFSPSSISAPYRNLTHLYPSNIDPKMDPKMWGPSGETRSIQSLYTIYIIPIQPLYIFDTHFVYQKN